MTDELLRKIYYDPKNAASFSGIEKIYKEAVKLKSDIRNENINKWFSGELIYTLHKSARKNPNQIRLLLKK